MRLCVHVGFITLLHELLLREAQLRIACLLFVRAA